MKIKAAGQPADDITVAVVYAEPNSAWQVQLTVPVGTKVSTVLGLSGFAQAFPAYPFDTPTVGIFGRRCGLDQAVAQGDRIEIYRPLNFDPMASRRRRAAHRSQAAEKHKKFRPRRTHGEDK